jgi:hypothetical protein
MIERFLKALENIAEELSGIRAEIRLTRISQEAYAEQAKRDADAGPKRVMDMFGQLRGLMGGKTDG